jgi:Holliday junction resolvase RusA-like endonuclease
MTDAPPDRIFHMPVPPSTNALWVRVGGATRTRARSPAYNAWIEEAGWSLRTQLRGCPPITCRFNALIEVPVSRRDTGNWEKPVMDLLEHVGAITNDGNAHEIIIRPAPRTDVMVALWALPDMGGVRGRPSARRGMRRDWERLKPGLAWRLS